MSRFAVFAVPFSPNLGDGVIFECLSHGIKTHLQGAEVVPVDLAGRQAYGEVSVRNRKLILQVLPYLPMWLRHKIVITVLGRRLARIRPRWAATLTSCDAAIIGGGQLFADADLNFPLKIAAVAEVAEGSNVPLAVFSVGAAGKWSPRGARLFGRVVGSNLRFLSGRDPFSTEKLTKALPLDEDTEIAVTPDPGLLAARRFPYSGPRDGIAICVAAEELLSYHADRPLTGGEGGTATLFAETALACIARGHKVRFFTNGADEDEQALDILMGRPELADAIADGHLSRQVRANTPEELCRVIAGVEGVIAHRLHACIVAYSYRIPVLGLAWDRKVESFFEHVDRPDLLVPESAAVPDEIAERITVEIRKGVVAEAHDRHLDVAQAAIGRMVDRLLEPS